MPLQPGLIRPPTLRRNREAHDERHATWLELFYDLVFVAGVAQLSHAFGKHYDLAGLGHLVLLGIPLWWAWVGHTFYLTRFDNDDLIHRLLTFLQMGGAAFMAVNIPHGTAETSAQFAWSYVFIRSILVIEYAHAHHSVPEVRPLTGRYLLSFSLAIVCWIVSTFFPAPIRFWLWGLGLVIDFAGPLTAGILHARFPPHLSHLPERFGLFTIITLGEVLIVTLNAFANAATNRASLTVGITGLMLVFIVWWLYFDAIKAADTRSVSGAGDIGRFQLWLYTHLPFTLALIGVGVGISKIIPLKWGEYLPPIDAWMFSGSVLIASICLRALYVSAQHGHRSRERTLVIDIPHLSLIVARGVLAVFAPWIPAHLLLIALTVLTGSHVLLSLRVSPYTFGEAEPEGEPSV